MIYSIKQIKCLQILWYIVFSITLYGCASDNLTFVNNKSNNYAYEISYEQETATTHKFSKPDNYSILQQINQMPVVSRQRIHLGIKPDGSVEWTITKLNPARPFNWRTEALPDSDPETNTICIIGSKASCFDKKGKFLYAFDTENPSMKNFIDSLKKGKTNYFSCINNAQPANNLKSLNNNFKTTLINDSITSYSKIIEATDNMPELTGKKYEKIINTRKGVVLGEAVFNQDGSFYYKTVNRFPQKLTEIPFPLTSRYEKYEINKKGICDLTTIITRYENVKITNNIN